MKDQDSGSTQENTGLDEDPAVRDASAPGSPPKEQDPAEPRFVDWPKD